MIIKTPAFISVQGKLIPIIKISAKPAVLVIKEQKEQLEEMAAYIDEIKEAAEHFRQDRDYWKKRAEDAERTAADLDDELLEVTTEKADLFEELKTAHQQARSYKQQAKIYAQEKLEFEKATIYAAKTIKAAGQALTEMKTVSPERGYLKAEAAAEILAAMNKLDMYA